MADEKNKPITEQNQHAAKQQSPTPSKPKKEAEKVAETRIQDVPVPTSGAKPVSSSKRTLSGLAWALLILNLIVCLLLAGAGFWAWQQWQSQQHQWQSQQQDWQSQQQDQQAYVSAQRSALAQQQTSNKQMQAEVANQRAALDDALQKLSRQVQAAEDQAKTNSRNLADISGRRPSDWLLAEADYLVKMAGRKLWLEHDVRTAILMLQSADSRLADLADPSLLSVRQRVADDIQTLQQINPVSLPSIAMAISGMLPQVKNLPLALPELPQIQRHNPELSDSVNDFEQNLSKTLAFFKDMFRYESRNTPVRPLLNQQQQWLAKEQLRLALLQAGQAVLKEQSALFEQTLQTAIGLLVDHYDLAEPAVEQFVASLKNLQESNIRRSYPTQLSAAQPLADLLKSRVDDLFQNRVDEL